MDSAVNDARAVARALTAHAGFREDQIILMTTDQVSDELKPTRTHILTQLAKLRGRVPEDGLLMFAYSGHGMQIGEHSYLIPSDTPSTSHSLLRTDTAISDTQLVRYLEDTRVNQVIATVDACRDLFTGKGVGEGQASTYPADFDLDIKNSGIAAFAVIQSASKGQISNVNSKNKRGYFSEAFTEALEGRGKAANDNGDVTLERLISYIEAEVPTRVNFDIERIQTPQHETKGFKNKELVIATRGTTSNIKSNALTNKDGLQYVPIPRGQFVMGCVSSDEKARNCNTDELPRHPITIGENFYMGKTEVTVRAYENFCLRTQRSMPEPPHFNAEWREREQPIVNVKWEEAQEYCQWAGGRLPTEAEWEYAARGGRSDDRFPWGERLDRAFSNSGGDDNEHGPDNKDGSLYAADVGKFPPNKYGLYDVAGNVWEWVADWYSFGYYKDSPDKDPPGPSQGQQRVIRGGSWEDGPSYLRSSFRNKFDPTKRSNSIGFRCVISAIPR